MSGCDRRGPRPERSWCAARAASRWSAAWRWPATERARLP